MKEVMKGMKIASATHKGVVRATNQDAYGAGELPGGVIYAVVCDGMGGANGGNIASELSVKTIVDQINASYRMGMSSNSVRRMIETAVNAANIVVFDMANANETLAGMGTTVVCAVLNCNTAHISHAGDSRAYLIREGKILQITKDHSVVQSMLENGQLTPDEARFHPRKNVITRALGVSESIEVDYDEIEMEPDDILLLCTDGLTNFVDMEEILSISSSVPLYELPDALINAANRSGGGDNITVVTIAL